MTHPVEILVGVEDSAWDDALDEVEPLVLRAAEAALAGARAHGVFEMPDGSAELSVMLADDATVRELNRTYRGKDKPTNVLSFALYADSDAPAEEEPFDHPDEVEDGNGDEDAESIARDAPPHVLLGDVILAFETVDRESREQGKALADHLVHLTVHGVLHLLGYDHIADDEAEEMERLETRILADLGISDPYAGPGGRRAPDDPDDEPGGNGPGAPTSTKRQWPI